MTVDNVTYGSGPGESGDYPPGCNEYGCDGPVPYEDVYPEDYPYGDYHTIAPTDQVNLIQCRYNQQG